MSRGSRQLAEARAARDAARAAFDAQLHRLRGDPQAQTIGERLMTRVGDDARGGMERALDVAQESKGIAAATAAVLALWFLRGPILGWLGDLWEAKTDSPDETELFTPPEEVSPHA